MKRLAAIFLTLSITLSGTTAVFGGQWKQDQNGWQYDYENGDIAREKWEQLNGSWYLFGANGYMLTGWQNVANTWYYFHPDGSMAANQWVGDYYLAADGAMAVNTTIDGSLIGADGKKQTPWQAEEDGVLPLKYWMEISAGKNTSLIKMQFENYSAADMKLVNGDNHISSNLDSAYDRDMVLADSSGNQLDSVVIKPGETKTVYYKPTSATWYDSRQNVMVVGIEYNGDYTLLFANIFDVPVD